ncbi:MAG: sigma factor [Planctomycetota bacterium]|jgi:RNA polymerase sigma-70 factor (ECF subfamily)|nr:sigma factor [Planctomycetota bacterium]MDP6761481.1 sigma factor [Planctomycetota bacterium]
MDLDGFIDRFRGPLIGLVASWGASPRDAVEIAQDAFAEAYLGRERFRGSFEDEVAAGAWLRGIARNLHHRGARRRATASLEAAAEPAVLRPQACR